jgi:ABC-type sugar transport system substrate-binding protein
MLAVALMGAATVARAQDVRLFVRHEVADYAAWRKAYDSFRPTQKKLGVFAQSVYVSADDPNDVTVVHDFHGLAKAKAFVASPDLRAAMEKAGVKGAPTVWFTTKAAK